MFLSSTAATELPVDIDIKAIKQLLDGFDPAALLPDIDTIVGKVQLVCTIAILIAPLVMLGLLAIAAINGVTMYTYDYNGTRRRKKRRPT